MRRGERRGGGDERVTVVVALALTLILALLVFGVAVFGQGPDIWEVAAGGGKTLIPINTQIRYSTQITLPPGELIVSATCGDREFWQVDWKPESNVAYVKPSKAGAKTNLHLEAVSGTTYHFALSESTSPPKLLVNVTNEDLDTAKAKAAGPRYVPVSAVEGLRADLEQAQKAIQAERTISEKAAEVERANWPKLLQFVYRIDGDKMPIAAAWHDTRFTYVKWEGLALPVLFEKNGDETSMLNFQVLEGSYITPKTFVIPKVIERQVLVKMGKKTGEITRKD